MKWKMEFDIIRFGLVFGFRFRFLTKNGLIYKILKGIQVFTLFSVGVVWIC